MKTALPMRFLLAVFLLIAVVTTAVPVVNWAQRPKGGAFTGFSFESVGDIFVYFNLIDQSAHGAWLFRDMFTSEPHAPALFNPYLLILGKLAAFMRVSTLVIWHLARVALLLPTLMLLWILLSQIVHDETRRRPVFLLVLGSGALVLSRPDGSTFLSMLYDGMALATLCLTIIFFLTVLRVFRSGLTVPLALALFFLPFLQAFIRPYVLFLWGAIPLATYAVDIFLRRRRPRASVVHLTAILFPVAAAYAALALILVRNPVLYAWSSNANGFAWAPDTVALFFGAQAPFALAGMWSERKRLVTDPAVRFVFLWLLVGFAATFSPYPYGYRLLQFLHIPLAAFSALGVVFLWRRPLARVSLRVSIVFFAALLFSDNIRHVVLNFSGAYYRASFRYLSAGHRSALAWLRDSTPPESVVLHSPIWDTLLAQQSFRPVYATQGWQTVAPIQKVETALDVYSGKYEPAALKQFLSRHNISYLYVSDQERVSGQWRGESGGKGLYGRKFVFDFHPEQYPFLREVFSNGTATIYSAVDDRRL